MHRFDLCDGDVVESEDVVRIRREREIKCSHGLVHFPQIVECGPHIGSHDRVVRILLQYPVSFDRLPVSFQVKQEVSVSHQQFRFVGVLLQRFVEEGEHLFIGDFGSVGRGFFNRCRGLVGGDLPTGFRLVAAEDISRSRSQYDTEDGDVDVLAGEHSRASSHAKREGRTDRPSFLSTCPGNRLRF